MKNSITGKRKARFISFVLAIFIVMQAVVPMPVFATLEWTTNSEVGTNQIYKGYASVGDTVYSDLVISNPGGITVYYIYNKDTADEDGFPIYQNTVEVSKVISSTQTDYYYGFKALSGAEIKEKVLANAQYNVDYFEWSEEEKAAYIEAHGCTGSSAPSVSKYYIDTYVDLTNTPASRTYSAPTLYAVYSITYNANGATSGSVPTATEAPCGIATATAENTGSLAKTGKSFAGWNTSASGGEATHIDPGAELTIYGDTTLYAEWGDPQLTVTYHENAPTGATVTGSVPDQVSTSEKFTVSGNTGNLAITGYEFDGWNSNASGTGTDYTIGQEYSITADLDLYAKWTPVYAVTLHTNGGYITDGKNVTSYKKGVGATLPTYLDISKAGNEFLGWFDNSGLSGTVYTSISTEATGAKEFWAKWNDEYTVTYMTYGGTLNVTSVGGHAVTTVNANQVYTHKYNYGETFSYPTNVTREGYAFKGWYISTEYAPEDFRDGLLGEDSGDITLHALWVELHTVTWKDGNGNTLKTEQVEDGSHPEYSGDTPTKTATAQYSYTFNNTWKPVITEITQVTADVEYTAQFDPTTNQYEITWVDGNGATIKTENVDYGTTPAYNAGINPGDDPVPTKTATTEYSYIFNGTWSPAITAVTGNQTYTAQFNESPREYTITWKDGNGDTIKTEDIAYGETPVYSGTTPTKTATAQYSYFFNGTWSPDITAVTGDKTYTAQFDQTVKHYQITWKNHDGTTLKSELLDYGETPEYDKETPTKASTMAYTYTFTTWSPAITSVTGDQTYTAQFNESPREYTITWKDGDENVLKTESIAFDSTPVYNAGTEPGDDPVPTKTPTATTAFLWDGDWYPAITAVYEDKTYTATFTSSPRVYDIAFVTNGGTINDTTIPEHYTYGVGTAIPSDVTKTGNEFQGWFANQDLTGTAVTAVSATDTGDKTFYAKWAPNEYNVTLHENGGTINSGNVTKYTYGVGAALPTNVTKNGYDFGGWFANQGLTGDQVTSIGTTETGAKEFWAKWTPTEYNITYVYGNGATAPNPDNPAKYTIETETFSISAPTMTGHEFDGWTVTGLGLPSTAKPKDVSVNVGTTGDLSFTANWKPNEYNVTLHENGGTINSGNVTKYTYGVGAALPTNVTKNGYDFGGWFANEGLTGEKVTAITATDIGDKEYWAKWTEHKYKITFNTNGGTQIAPIILEAGKHVNAPADPTRDGYAFVGWDKAIPSVMPASDMTINALWDKKEFTITFDTKGGTEIAPITQEAGTAVNAPADPTKEGFTFAGWDREIPKTMPEENITVTAIWNEISYTITFNTDGGTAIAPIVQLAGTAVTAPDDPTKEGYLFDGWDRVIPSIMPAENMVITASWKRNSFTITFDTLGGSYVAPITQEYGTEVSAPAAPTKDDHVFFGWSPAVPDTMPAHDTICTAQWRSHAELYPIPIAGEKKEILPDNPEPPADNNDNDVSADDDKNDDDTDDTDDIDDDTDDEDDIDDDIDDDTGDNDDDANKFPEDDGTSMLKDNIGYYVEVVWLEPSDEMKRLVRSTAGTLGMSYLDGMYWDIRLYRTVDGEIVEQMFDIDMPQTVQIRVPDAYRPIMEMYAPYGNIVRIHEDEIAFLPCRYDAETGIITFSSDKFSDYAFVYSLDAESDENPETDVPFSGLWVFAVITAAAAVAFRPSGRKK